MRPAVIRNSVLALVVAVSSIGTATAAPILTGNATISFTGDFGGGPGSVNESDVVAVAAGPEIAFGDGSNIGTFVLLDFESLDLNGLTITYTIQGGSNVDAVQAGYGDNGMLAGEFSFSNLVFSPNTTIVGISTVLTDVLDPSNVVSLFSFTANSLTMTGLEQLLISSAGLQTGTIAVTLQVRDQGPGPGPVPEPATLALMGAGLALASRRVRKIRR